jgi:hypothetical protein
VERAALRVRHPADAAAGIRAGRWFTACRRLLNDAGPSSTRAPAALVVDGQYGP